MTRNPYDLSSGRRLRVLGRGKAGRLPRGANPYTGQPPETKCLWCGRESRGCELCVPCAHVAGSWRDPIRS
jgi:hypothetical protein